MVVLKPGSPESHLGSFQQLLRPRLHPRKMEPLWVLSEHLLF